MMTYGTGRVPSERAIRRRFAGNVTLPKWRLPTAQDPVVTMTGPARVLLEHFCAQARDLEVARKARIAAIHSRAALLAHGRRVRRALRVAVGLASLPPRTPLRPRVTLAGGGEGYRLEHVVFESRPQFYVTANLFLPLTSPPYPTVLLIPGHHPAGKQYYGFPAARTLAMHGLAVLVIDPVGQGERDEYTDRDGTRTVSRACRQHGAAGDPAYLLGSNFAAYRLWDSMRALDYLQSRADVVASRLGVTGTSGGGWESVWLAALDPRVRAVYSSCYLTTWRRRMENRGMDAEPDPEQDPFGILAAGLDIADVLLACFPRPIAFGATTRDFFPLDGARACHREAAALYRMGGCGDRIELTVADAGHAFTPPLRNAMYRWMLQWLAGGEVSRVRESAAEPMPEAASRCTKTGCVRTALGGITTGELNAHQAGALARQRASRRACMSRVAWARRVRQRLADVLRVALPRPDPDVHVGAARQRAGLSCTPLTLTVQDAFQLHAHVWEPRAGEPAPAIVLLREKGPDVRPERDAFCRRLCAAGWVVLDFDPRGMGPQGETWADFVPLEQADLGYDAFLLGESLPGLRTADVLDGLAALRTRSTVDPARLVVYGQGNAALLALFAGCLDHGVSHIVEDQGLISYSELTWHRDYAWPVHVVVPGALRHFDLEDIRAACVPRRLTVIAPRDHRREPLAPGCLRQEFSVARKAYAAAGLGFRLRVEPEVSDLPDALIRCHLEASR